VDEFEHNCSSFYQRNSIWSMRNNFFYIPDYSEDVGSYKALLRTETQETVVACVMDQGEVGMELIAFNYFPSEGVQLFLKQ
jgi:hypothetical protein